MKIFRPNYLEDRGGLGGGCYFPRSDVTIGRQLISACYLYIMPTHHHLQQSQVDYTPTSEHDYGNLLCWAQNSIGVQVLKDTSSFDEKSDNITVILRIIILLV